jgi:hypothetical protein
MISTKSRSKVRIGMDRSLFSSSLMLRSVLASPFSLKVLFGKARTLSSISRNLKYFHHCMTLNFSNKNLQKAALRQKKIMIEV